MPRFTAKSGLDALRASEGDGGDPSTIVRAARVGCTDDEIAGLLGLRPSDFARILEEDAALRRQLDALRAERRLQLRATVQAVATDDEHPAQGRILREILVGELQALPDEQKGGDFATAIATILEGKK